MTTTKAYATPKRAYPGSRRNGAWGGRTTRIRVGNEEWVVPRGFGAAYLREVEHQVALFRKQQPAALLDRVRGCLELAGYTASIETLSDWSLLKRVEVVVWAQHVHLRASDNPVLVPPRPKWMGEPWQGPREGKEGTVWESPGPTVLT